MESRHANGREGEPRLGRWLGAAGAAGLLASACCLGPILLAGLGLSVAGVSSFFEPLRPAFLAVTGVLLGAGFYASYFRRPTCGPGAACAVDGSRQRRTRALLWLASIVVVLVALFPVYGEGLLRAGRTGASQAGEPGRVVRLAVSGMTCGACAATLEQSLRGLPGVRSATVSYPDGEAVVETARDAAPSPDQILETVKRAGYRALVEE